MEKKYRFVIMLCVLVASWFNEADAISCYECSSLQNNECHKDVSNNIVPCDDGVKQCFMEEISTENGRYISRGCLEDDIKNYCYTIKRFALLRSPIHKVIKCYTCESDLCNTI
nr:uncharacterized protein LOC111424264 [Onthophagus taurus]